LVPAIDSHAFLAGVRDASLAGAVARAASAKGWTPLFIVASPRPRSGKTFLARLVIDFLRLDGASIKAFDLDPGEAGLAEQMPLVARHADIASTESQMALFDRLIVEDGVPKVIDLGHALFERFFQLLEEIGFMQEAVRRSLEPVILYAAHPHPASPDAYCRLRKRFPEMILVPVFNGAIVQGRRLRDDYPFNRAATVPLKIPLLSPPLRPYAERARHSFADFHRKLPPEIPARHAAELRSWTKRAFLELRELELRLLLDKLRASLRAPG
jgi:hypothetical protein